MIDLTTCPGCGYRLAAKPPPDWLRFSSRGVIVAGVAVPLTPTEQAILRALATGGIYDAARLLGAVWDIDALEERAYNRGYVGYDVAHIVRVNMARLRKRLKDAGAPDIIESIPGRGYRLRAQPAQPEHAETTARFTGPTGQLERQCRCGQTWPCPAQPEGRE